MTAREVILAAIDRILARSDRDTFTMRDILDDIARHQSDHGLKESTIRTHIVSVMCVSAPSNHGVRYPDLERVGYGTYRLYSGRTASLSIPSTPRPPTVSGAPLLTENEVKKAVKEHLEAAGWTVQVAWDRESGADIIATRGTNRLILEAKAEVRLNPQQVNYFLGALGELVQRMDDPKATYGLALPDNKQYRGLVGRLPTYAVKHLGLVVFWVGHDGRVTQGFAGSV